MKKIRILAVILAVLMLPMALFVACDNDSDPGEEPQECVNGHRLGLKETISKRTCTTPGIEHRKCTRCPYVQVDETPATGHVLDELTSDNNATCTEDGTASKKCRLCSYRETENMPGSALGHRFLTYTRIDDYTEKSICHRCGKGEDIRLTGLYIDFEGDKSHPSYDKLTVFTDTDAVYAEETVGGVKNSYLTVTRAASTVIGSTEFGVVLAPRADVLKGTSADSCPSYVVSFSIRIKKNETKDLILLQGSKDGVKETFLTYDSAAGTINSNEGVVYVLAAEDYGNWLDIAVRLNDGKKVYEVYVNNKIVTSAYGAGSTAISYVNKDAYFMGYSLESLKIAMAAADGVASTFDVDNILLYVAEAVKGYEGATNVGFKVYETAAGDKIVYKASAEGCTCAYVAGEPVAASCVTSGYTLATCATCGGQEVTNVVAPVNHNWITVSTVDASCTVAAYTNSECDKCGARNIVYTGDPLGHEINTDPATGYKIVAPHCLTEGWTEGVCVRCEYDMLIDVTEPLGHEPDHVTEGAVAVIAPTCLEEGYTVGKCVRYADDGDIKGCGYEFERTEVVAALGHACANPTTVAPTCTEAGYNDCVCDRCQEKYTDTEVAALGHVNVSEMKVVEGVTKLINTCSRCNTVTLDQELLAAVPTYEQMSTYFADNGNQLAKNDYHFENDAANMIRGSLKSQVSSGSFIGRYGTLTTKLDLAEGMEENQYGEWEYAPSNAADASKDAHCYFDLGLSSGSGRNWVFEMSFRQTAGTSMMMDFFIQAIDRSLKHSTANLFSSALFNISTKGDIFYQNANNVIGKVTADKWTRVALVFKSNPDAISTYDIYIDGNLMVADIEMSTKGYDTVDQIRCQRNSLIDGKIDIDEVYCYYADYPYYVQSIIAPEKPEDPPVFPDTTTKVPTSSDMTAYFDVMQNKLNSGIFNFDGDATGTVRGDNNALPAAMQNGFNGRYATLTTKDDSALAGNKYGEWYYTPANKKGSDSVHAYFDINPKTAEGKDVVVEFSARKTAGETELMPFNFQLIDRSGKYHAEGKMISHTIVNVNKDGEIIPQGMTEAVGTVTADGWTRVAAVIHTKVAETTTFDVYVNGNMVAKNIALSAAGYDIITDVRFQVADQSTKAPGRKVDIDEVYCYYSSKPYYCISSELSVPDTTTKVPTSSDMAVWFDVKKNKIDASIYNFDSDAVGTVRGDNNKIAEAVNGFVGRYGTLTTKEDTLISGNRYGQWYYTPENNQGKDSVHTYFDLGPNTKSGETWVFEVSLRIPEGETKVMPFGAELIDRSNQYNKGAMWSGNLFNVDADGNIATKDKSNVVGKIAADAWTRIALVIHSNPGAMTTYDMYVDGCIVGKDMYVSDKLGWEQTANVRVQRGDDKVGGKLDMDEVYMYYADKPYYMVSDKLPMAPAEPGKVAVNVSEIEGQGGKVIAAYDFEQDAYVAGDYMNGGKAAAYKVDGAGSNFKDGNKNLIKLVEDANGNKYYQYAKKDEDSAKADHYFDIMFCPANSDAALKAAQALNKIGASFVFTMDFMPGTFEGTLVTLTTRHSSGQYGDAFAAIKVAGNVLQDKDGNPIATLTAGEFSTVAVLFVPGTSTEDSKYYVYVNRVRVTPEGVAFISDTLMNALKDANGDGTVTCADYVPNHVRLAQTSAVLADDMAFDNIAIYYADTYFYEVAAPEDATPPPSVTLDGEQDAIYAAGDDYALSKAICDAFTADQKTNGAGCVGAPELAADTTSVSFKFAVDDNYLYIFETRKDATPNYTAKDYKRPYTGDGSLLWFMKGDAATPTSGIQWSRALTTSADPQFGVFYDNNQDAAKAKAWACAVKTVSATEYTLEVAIPLADLKLTKADFVNGNVKFTFCTVDIINSSVNVDQFDWAGNGYQMQQVGVDKWTNAPVLVVGA